MCLIVPSECSKNQMFYAHMVLCDEHQGTIWFECHKNDINTGVGTMHLFSTPVFNPFRKLGPVGTLWDVIARAFAFM